MNMDTSSSPRQEWYEADYEPDVLPITYSFDVFTGAARKAGKTAHSPAFGGYSLDLIISAKSYIAALDKLADKIKQIASDRPNEAETVRERALRLAKQPHSMAQDPYDFHFDHRGRRRY